MTDFTQYFKEQLDAATPCDGDFLQGRTFSEAVKELQASREKVTPPFLPEGQEPVKFDAAAHIERRIKDSADHRGQKMLFFMIEHSPGHIEVLKVWEGELAEAMSKLSFSRMATSAMPVFTPVIEAP